jgi:hypothetical protein
MVRWSLMEAQCNGHCPGKGDGDIVLLYLFLFVWIPNGSQPSWCQEIKHRVGQGFVVGGDLVN